MLFARAVIKKYFYKIISFIFFEESRGIRNKLVPMSMFFMKHAIITLFLS